MCNTVLFNNRTYQSNTKHDKVYLTDISDNKIKINITYSTNEDNNKKSDDALTDFWSREVF